MVNKSPETITDVINEGTRIINEDIRMAKLIMDSDGAKDPMAKAYCDSVFTKSKYLYDLKLISLKEYKMIHAIMTDEIRKNSQE